MLQYLLHRLTVSPDKSGQRSQLHKRLFVPTKPLPARPALLHQVYTSLHCIPYVVCCQQGLECETRVCELLLGKPPGKQKVESESGMGSEVAEFRSNLG